MERNHGRPGSAARLPLGGPMMGLIAALLFGAISSPTGASASWTAPINISVAGQTSRTPQVGIDNSGRAVLTWATADGGHYLSKGRTLSPAGHRGPIMSLSPAGVDATDQDVAVDPEGHAVLSWLRTRPRSYPHLQARMLSPSTLGPIVDVSTAGWLVVSPQVAIDGGGTAVLSWSQCDVNARLDGGEQARTLSPTGTLGPTMNLRQDIGCQAHPRVDVTSAGQAVFAWVDGMSGQVDARTLSPTGTLGPLVTVSIPGHSTDQPEVGIDNLGNAVVVWDDATSHQVQARRMSASGVLGPVKVVSSISSTRRFPQVAVTGDGNATLVWLGDDGGHMRILARSLSASGVLGPVKKVSGPDPSSPGAGVAVDDHGSATIAWISASGVGARKMSSAAALGPVKTFGVTAVAARPPVAVDPAGEAVVAWTSHGRIQAAIRR